jgi:eukaryotic-like serine/threonine-protein kinase
MAGPLPPVPDAASPERWIADFLLACDAARAAGLPLSQPGSPSGGELFKGEADVARRLALVQSSLARLHRRWPWPGTGGKDDEEGEPLAGLGLTLGRYTLLSLIGSGGHGLVFLADDPTLRRKVALKVPRPEWLASDRHRKRFLREAHALGRLDHPGIVPIHDFGESGPVCYLAMAYIDGPNLAHWLASREGPLAPATAASLLLQLAEAAAHAHSRGVLHRDLKPGNVMMDTSEHRMEPVPRITDFGLAKILDDARDEYRTDTLPLGTPRFMAPEQTSSERGQIGPATDIYALGAILYVILTGAAPEGPIKPHERGLANRSDPHHPLRQVAARCLERDPKDRYQSAEALADDLQRFLAGHPVNAPWLGRGILRRALSEMTTGRRWLALVAVLVPVLLASTLILLLARREFVAVHSGPRPQPPTNSSEIRTVEASALEKRYLHDIQRAFELIGRNHDVRTADAEFLDRWTDGARADGPDPRRFEWGYLKNLGHRESITVRHGKRADGAPSEVYDARFSPDGTLLLTAGQDGAARIWDSVTGKPLGTPLEHPNEVNWAAFSPDGKLIATASDDGMIRLWDLATRLLKRQLPHSAGRQAVCVLFTPDGRRLASGARDHCLVIWDIESGAEVVRHDAKLGEIEALAVSSVGSVAVAVGAEPGRLALLNYQDGTLRWQNYVASVGGHSVDVSPDGHSVATTSQRDTLVVDLDGKAAQRALSDHRDLVFSVAFSPDGARLATGSHNEDPTLRIWNMQTGLIQEVLPSHIRRVWSLRFSPDGLRLASASGDGTAKIWEFNRLAHQRFPPLTPSAAGYKGFALHHRKEPPDRSNSKSWGLLAVNGNGKILALDSDGKQQEEPLFCFSGPIAGAAISPGCDTVAAVLTDRSLHIADLSAPHLPAIIVPQVRLTEESLEIAVNRAGDLVAARDYSTGDVLVIEARSGRVKHRIQHESVPFRTFGFIFMPDGRHLLAHQRFGPTSLIWDLSSGIARTNPEPPARGSILSWAIAPDGRLIATGDQSDAIFLRDATSLELKATMHDHGDDVHCLAFSPDGRRLASGDRAGAVRLWDVATGEKLLELEGLHDIVHFLQFTPDGMTLIGATCHDGGHVVVWHGQPR